MPPAVSASLTSVLIGCCMCLIQYYINRLPPTSHANEGSQKQRLQDPKKALGSGAGNIFSSLYSLLLTKVTSEDEERLDASGEWIFKSPSRNESRTCYGWQAAGWKSAEQASNFSKYILKGCGSHFNCPITQDIIVDAVVAADGNTYERAAIKDWFRSQMALSIRLSPATGQPIQSFVLIRNCQYHSYMNSLKDSFLKSLSSPSELKSITNTDCIEEIIPQIEHSESVWAGVARIAAFCCLSFLSNILRGISGSAFGGSIGQPTYSSSQPSKRSKNKANALTL